MEAHGNEYVAQLLDRAANLIQPHADSDETTENEAAQWLREYHQEKARFGQPEGSPAYADTRGIEEGSEVDQPGDGRRTRTSAPRAQKDDGTPAKDATTRQGEAPPERPIPDDASLSDLQDEARRRGLPTSGTKAELRDRLGLAAV
jgi:hypothetical protein